MTQILVDCIIGGIEYPSTNEDIEFERFMAIFEALPRDTELIVDVESTNNVELTVDALESLLIKAFPIKALPVKTNESAIPVEIDKCNQLAIPFTNTT
jgi:hypothetical protein